jgi:hypothetical protein
MGEMILAAPDHREAKAKKIRRGILAAQLRVKLDEVRGRETPEAVVRLSQLELPRLPQPGRKINFANRVDAAAKAMSNAWRNMHTNESLGFQSMLAEHAIAASDAAMFSDESVKRAAERLSKQFTVETEVGEYDATAVYATPEEIVRAVIEELKKS